MEHKTEEQLVNEANARNIFTPPFIQYRMHTKRLFKLNHLETVVHGFIRFYKEDNLRDFYFTNALS